MLVSSEEASQLKVEFFAAPVHQLQQYYRFGQADDCLGHWSTLYACLKKRTKFAHQVQHRRANGEQSVHIVLVELILRRILLSKC